MQKLNQLIPDSTTKAHFNIMTNSVALYDNNGFIKTLVGRQMDYALTYVKTKCWKRIDPETFVSSTFFAD